MILSQNGFYALTKEMGNTIHIEHNIYVSLFITDNNQELKIYIGENTKVDIYGFFTTISPPTIFIYQHKEKSTLQFKALFLSNTENLTSHISSQIDGNDIISNIHIISIVKEHFIGIDSDISIQSGSKNIQARLDLENIFIGKKGTLHSNPNLFINSQDVKVSHSSKTHRIEEQKLFYLTSRGLSEKESIQLLIESYFKKTLNCIEMFDKHTFDKIQEIFLKLN